LNRRSIATIATNGKYSRSLKDLSGGGASIRIATHRHPYRIRQLCQRFMGGDVFPNAFLPSHTGIEGDAGHVGNARAWIALA
jgi:hypothetical protein